MIEAVVIAVMLFWFALFVFLLTRKNSRDVGPDPRVQLLMRNMSRSVREAAVLFEALEAPIKRTTDALVEVLRMVSKDPNIDAEREIRRILR